MMNLTSEAVNLDQLFELMDEDMIYQRTNKPLDNAFSHFATPDIEDVTHEGFNSVLGDFFQHINRYGLNARILTKDEALQEGVWFLESYYPPTDDSGYEEAYLYALNKGYSDLLEQILEFMKSVERKKYMNWIFLTIVKPMNWDLKRKLAEKILERFGHHFPQNMKNLLVGQLANDLETVIETVV
jgi:hypothetical protein